MQHEQSVAQANVPKRIEWTCVDAKDYGRCGNSTD